jgi:transposase
MKGIYMKKNVMSFVMVIVVLILMGTIGYSENKIEKESSVSETSSYDWVKYFETYEGNVFLYRKINVEKDERNYTVRLWEKRVFSDKDREKKLQNRRKMGVSTEEYDKLSHSLDLLEIECNKEKIRILSDTEYNTSGGVLSSNNVIKEWGNIIPDSVQDILQKKVCPNKQ